ncbi:MAG: hypothetical protein PHH54_02920 [Candidatus Nanoarchaeia archaeon]|nr:hypothetical protein [Candidatus Nanoarchaeia archaeon]MDD5740912.1 hypothetical protein [Candidatus Nanoarchaeia archaeon]
MENKKFGIIILVLAVLVLSIIPFASAEASPWPAYNVCCEKTKNGAWCQNTLEENCDTSFDVLSNRTLRVTTTSCEATSFCKPGCCYDSQEGLCMENTPQKICNDGNGTWTDNAECNIPQCSLGCCVTGNQASFVTLTRCKMLSGLYGLETDFRKDIADEVTCISVASLGDEGACVYEVDYRRTCKFTTRSECSKTKSGGNETSQAEFFKDYLCSAEELAANCGPSTKTACIEGKQEVYFIDTCGNPANIYDSSRINDKSYWQKKIDKNSSCEYNEQKGNAGSKSCGNCDYFMGSICSKGSASYGDYICKDLNCYDTKNGKDYKNGESWCVYDSASLLGKGKDPVGSRHYRHVCIMGEETIEPCADYRGEQCIQDDIKTDSATFTEAACRANRWVDCMNQKERKNCENIDKRDCYWLEGAQFTGLTAQTTAAATTPAFSGGGTGGFSGGTTTPPLTGNAIFGSDDKKETEKSSGVQLGGGACLPNIPPGLKFWSGGESQGVCSLGNSKCVVTYEKGLIGSEKCIKNCECLEQSYAQMMNRICISIGDCGAYVNIANKFTSGGADWKIKGSKKTITQGILGGLK